MEIKYIGGKDPEMVFLDGEGNATEVSANTSHFNCYFIETIIPFREYL